MSKFILREHSTTWAIVYHLIIPLDRLLKLVDSLTSLHIMFRNVHPTSIKVSLVHKNNGIVFDVNHEPLCSENA